ncbi:putative MFS family arabinose efflux permease [Kutzneria buriramensis]|uniref:Putative MFS family arabinose efflux permease n=1 Tax=Kutzneria buriramensis TaxID=1045776 RepID=A0A3E0HEH7_9PSEU|nr:putative MFS family arabinose efflux permease [Kutzneria buriramensis]
MSGVSPRLTLLMALACGLIVANIYYVQPLLPDLAASFRAPTGVVGLSVTTTQLGYAAGLVLLVPLGDLMAKRRLVVVLLCASAVALALTAVANSPTMLLITLALVGLSSVAVNVLMPLAATLAGDGQRGRVVGSLMTGLLLGVLLARTVSGALEEIAGWHAVFGIAALVEVVLAVVLRLALPDPPVARGLTYPQLLTSITRLVRDEPFLRRRMMIGALGFASFQLLWTSLPFLLAGPPYSFSTATIGSFGLIGAAGVLCAQAAGRLQDKGMAHAATGVFALVLGASWLLLGGGAEMLPLLVIGIVVLDIGVQGLHVINQGRIYAYGPSVKSRVTTAYMTSYFVGGSLGGALAVTLYTRFGWIGVCVAGGVLFALTGILWLTDRTKAPSPELTK